MSLQIDSATLAHRIAVLEEIGVGPLWLRRGLMPDSMPAPMPDSMPGSASAAIPDPMRRQQPESAVPALAPAAASVAAAAPEAAASTKTILTLCTSADVNDTARYLFVSRASGEPDAETLFDNILLALGMRKEAGMQGDLAGLPAQVAAQRPSVLVAMGAAIAQELTGNGTDSGNHHPGAEKAGFESLRGRLHRLGDLPLLATYDAAHLVRNPADKRGAWDDLCLLMHLKRPQAADAADPA